MAHSDSMLSRARALEPRAWEQICTIYGPTVYQWCRAKGANPEDAADIVQDVFHTAFRSLDQFSSEAKTHSFRRWLYAIFRTRLIDHFRRQQRQPVAGGGTDYGQLIHDRAEWFDRDEIDPDESDPGILSRAMKTVREEVQPNTWLAFWKTAVDGERPVDVAEALGMSSAAVCMSRSRVLRRIRRLLDGLEVFPE